MIIYYGISPLPFTLILTRDFDCYIYRMCAPVMVELEGETDPLAIAMKELK